MGTSHSNYLRTLFASPTIFMQAVNILVDNLKDVEYDSIAVRGVSGAVMGGCLSGQTGKQLTVVRKRGVDSHKECHGQCEGLQHGPHKYIIVDDFVSSGATLAHIISEIQLCNPEAECVGFIVYHEEKSNTFVPCYGDVIKENEEQVYNIFIEAAILGNFDPERGVIDNIEWERNWQFKNEARWQKQKQEEEVENERMESLLG